MKTTSLTLTSLLICLGAAAQSPPPNGGGAYQLPTAPCVTPELRSSVVAMLQANLHALEVRGQLPAPQAPEMSEANAVLFDWPLRLAPGVSYRSYYGISNYVDQDTAFPNKLLDYNCGNRSYDLASGYNHPGTDIFTWPFSRLMQANNTVQVIAAQAGTVIGKSDGNADNSCAMCTACQWNAVFIRHADGSVAWYGHMKKNSLTAKNVGDAVAKAEYLGIVGSSGSSTGPHLHFEVYRNSTFTLANRIDPYAGPCNRLNGNTTWWVTQKPYREPMVNRLVTHHAPPVFGTCPELEKPNDRREFQQGDTVYFATYYHDQQQGATTQYSVLQPDASIFRSWSHNAPSTYNASYWYWWYILPSNAPVGTWTFRTLFNGMTDTVQFSVKPSTPTAVLNLANGQFVRIYPNPAPAEAPLRLEWRLDGARQRPVQVRVWDLNGRLHIYRPSVRSGQPIPMPTACGVYVVEVFVSARERYRLQVARQ